MLLAAAAITFFPLVQSPEDEQALLVMLAVTETFSPLLQSPEDEQVLLVMFAVVHLFAMSSACANPVLYGFLNENFKQVTVTSTVLFRYAILLFMNK